MEHNHIALRAMLAEHAAADVERRKPPMLFALAHDPVNGYGVIPTRPWNEEMRKAIETYPDANILAGMVDMAQRHLAYLPGLNTAQIAVQVCHEDPEVRPWFPGVTEHTRACGIAYRTEAWAAPVPADGTLPDRGKLSLHPQRIELIKWSAVCEDDTFHEVAWVQGHAAPIFDHFAFSDTRYDPRMQNTATQLRGLMRVNRRAARYNFTTGKYEKPDKETQ